MNRKHMVLIAGLAMGGLASYATGCGNSSDNKFFVDPDGGADGGGGDDACFFGCDDSGLGDGNVAHALIVNPPTALLHVVDANVQTQAFTVTLDGVDVTASAQFSFSTPAIGDVISNATFTPTGKVGGVGALTATVGNSTGQATVTVDITKTITGGIGGTIQQALDTPTGGADPAMAITYPFNETFFPLSVLAPEVMWNGAGASDSYKLKITEKYFSYTEYFTTTNPARHLMTQGDWDSIESSGSGPKSDPLKIELTRYSVNKAFNPVTQAWHVVQGKLYGSVYYWELPDACGSARVLRIKPGSAVVDPFFPNGGACWGCHTVSRDGRTVLGNFDFPFSTVDVSVTPAVKGATSYNQGTFGAFNETGKKALIARSSFGGYAVDLVDIGTGANLTPSIFTTSGEPAWSPDGKKVAVISGLSGGGWEFDSSSGDLTIADISGNAISGKKTIVTKASGTGRPAYPSFAPTSDYITYGRPTSGSRSTGPGDIWLTDLAGAAKKLDQASKDSPTSANYRSYNGAFAPLRAGGYSWIVFITRRDYGNRLVGTDRQQLWVTAIDDPPTAADPSHPAFYMRGQEDCAKSENAYYALDPCKTNGQSCTSGVDCCGGNCNKDPQTQKYVCGDPKGGCAEIGNKCSVASDCCNFTTSNVKCTDGFCQLPPPN